MLTLLWPYRTFGSTDFETKGIWTNMINHWLFTRSHFIWYSYKILIPPFGPQSTFGNPKLNKPDCVLILINMALIFHIIKRESHIRVPPYLPPPWYAQTWNCTTWWYLSRIYSSSKYYKRIVPYVSLFYALEAID